MRIHEAKVHSPPPPFEMDCVEGQSLLLDRRKLAAFWKLLQHLTREQLNLQTVSPM